MRTGTLDEVKPGLALALLRIGIAGAIATLCVGCTHTRLYLAKDNGEAQTGQAFVGDQLIDYQIWKVMSTGGFLGLQLAGSGEVYACIDPELEKLRLENPERTVQTAETSFTVYGNPYERHTLKAWNALGYRGWLFCGRGCWSNGLLPFLFTDVWHDPTQIKSSKYQRYTHVNLWEGDANGTDNEMVLIAIVPPVIATFERKWHAGLLDRFSGATHLCRWKPELDREYTINGLWSVTRVPGTHRVKGVRLIPEGTTMTLGEVQDKGPTLWREELEAMRDQVEPGPIKHK